MDILYPDLPENYENMMMLERGCALLLYVQCVDIGTSRYGIRYSWELDI